MQNHESSVYKKSVLKDKLELTLNNLHNSTPQRAHMEITDLFVKVFISLFDIQTASLQPSREHLLILAQLQIVKWLAVLFSN